MEKLSPAKIILEMDDRLTDRPLPSRHPWLARSVTLNSLHCAECTHEIYDWRLSLLKYAADIGFRFRWMVEEKIHEAARAYSKAFL